MKKENLNMQLKVCHSEFISESRVIQNSDNWILNRVQDDGIGSESGRSMVEMLGVLAIMGLLTIMGIMGFRYAMNKHYANQTVERLMRRAVVLAGQANFGQNPSLHEFDENDGEYPISRTLKSTSESFTMRVDNVPQEVCQQIVGMEWKLAKIIPENCSDETMEFMFLNDLTDCTDCQPDTFPCEDYGKECGKCSVVKGYTRNDDDCSDEDKPYCVLGKCSKCAPGQTTYNDGCKACSQIGVEILSDPDACHQCIDNKGKPTRFLLDLGHCVDCNYNQNNWAASLEECNRCPNRCLTRDRHLCGLVGGNNFAAYTHGEGGWCDCAEGYYLDTGNHCFSCSEITAHILNNPEDCHKCMDANNKPTHYQINLGHCVSCNYTEDNIDAAWATTIQECNRCDNRCLTRWTNACIRMDKYPAYTRDDATGYCVCATGYHLDASNQCVAD